MYKVQSDINKNLLLLLFSFGDPHLAVLWDYMASNPGQLCASQVPCPLYYLYSLPFSMNKI